MFKLKLLKFYYKLSYDLVPSYFQTYREVIERESTRDLIKVRSVPEQWSIWPKHDKSIF